jgi:hypothetical protein
MLMWIQAHSGMIMSVLSLIVALDHVLASNDLFKANSSLQAVLNMISAVAGKIQALLGSKSE